MRRGRVNAAALTAAAFFAGWFCLSAGPSRADESESRVILFSGRDIWRNGAALKLELKVL